MKKYNAIFEAIQTENLPKLHDLIMELYNDVRDFSQAIDIFAKDGSLIVQKHDGCGTDEYLLKLKERIREWVGGR